MPSFWRRPGFHEAGNLFILGARNFRVEGLEFGEKMPVLTDMVVDWEGRIWVEQTGPRVGEKGPIDQIVRNGRYLGSSSPGEWTMPDAFGPRGLAACVETDELDVPRVVVRRVTVGG